MFYLFTIFPFRKRSNLVKIWLEAAFPPVSTGLLVDFKEVLVEMFSYLSQILPRNSKVSKVTFQCKIFFE